MKQDTVPETNEASVLIVWKDFVVMFPRTAFDDGNENAKQYVDLRRLAIGQFTDKLDLALADAQRQIDAGEMEYDPEDCILVDDDEYRLEDGNGTPN